MSRRLYFYVPEASHNRDANDFLEFAQSEAGQEIVKHIGFVSQNIESQKISSDPSYPAEYRSLIASADRLSLNVRFLSGSNQPDTKALRDLQRIVEYVGRHPGVQLILAGFSDGRGNDAANLQLSLERAKSIATELSARGVSVQEVMGFGGAIPIAGNQLESDREKNRRVEVWVRNLRAP